VKIFKHVEKRTAQFTVSGLIFVTLTSSLFGETKEWSTEIHDMRLYFAITEKDIETMPEWKSASPEPPLPPGEAIRLSKIEFATYVTNIGDWHFDGLTLKQWGDGAHWIYEANFRHRLTSKPNRSGVSVTYLPIDGSISFQGSTATIAVLLSGAVVHPRIIGATNNQPAQTQKLTQKMALLPAGDIEWYGRAWEQRKELTFTVTGALIEKTPAWKTESPSPPLSARDALRLGKAELAKFVPDAPA